LVGERRLKDLAWATELMEANHKEFHFLIFGDGPYRWRLDRYVRQIEHADRIHLVGQCDDWARYLPHLDCFWQSATPHGTPVEMLEAMLAGVPVVSADVPSVREIIVNNESGFLVPLGDRAEFARRTTVLLEDSALAQSMGKAGQRRVRELCPIEPWVERHREVYSALD
jgi:glycosyltransferase involved in cell wall biosynthesis